LDHDPPTSISGVAGIIGKYHHALSLKETFVLRIASFKSAQIIIVQLNGFWVFLVIVFGGGGDFGVQGLLHAKLLLYH
jgi:hypothetical protein